VKRGRICSFSVTQVSNTQLTSAGEKGCKAGTCLKGHLFAHGDIYPKQFRVLDQIIEIVILLLNILLQKSLNTTAAVSLP
jgi:hypothetical protein